MAAKKSSRADGVNRTFTAICASTSRLLQPLHRRDRQGFATAWQCLRGGEPPWLIGDDETGEGLRHVAGSRLRNSR